MKRRFLPFLFIFCAALPAPQPAIRNPCLPDRQAQSLIRNQKDFALFFAVNDYTNDKGSGAWPDLTGPVKDAEEIAQKMRDLYGFTTEVVKNPSLEMVGQKLDEYYEKAYAPDAQLFIFFSGHGYFIEKKGEGFFIPRDGKRDGEDPTQSSWLSLLRLRRQINSLPCRHILLAIDACFSGTFDDRVAGKDPTPEEEITRPGENQMQRDKRIGDLLQEQSRLYCTSGGKERTPDPSAFAAQFKAALSDLGGNDNILKMRELEEDFLSNANPRPRVGTFEGHVAGGNFLFLYQAAAPIQNVPEKGGSVSPDQARDRLAWEAAAAKNTLAAYREYKRQFPQGDFVPLAEEAIGQLDEDAAWTAAKVQNTEAGYRDFIARFPGSAYKALAEARLKAATSKDLVPDKKPEPKTTPPLSGSTGPKANNGEEKSQPKSTPPAPDPVLFSIKNTSVPVSEFTYIYKKANQGKADFSETPLREYLNFYVNFKLKVQKARDMRLDTTQSVRDELSGYRKQLSQSFLEDKEVVEKLVRETYDRMLQDVDISHIFVTCDKNAAAADTLKAFNRAKELLRTVNSGKSFEDVAFEQSEDKSAKDNRGNLGFVTAMLPDGYYALEKAVYAARPGTILGPVRTNSGYHIVRVNAFRPARGEIEAAQILIRKTEDATQNQRLKLRADSVYTLAQNGMKWDELCLKYSQDKTTAEKGGYIGFFGINKYQRSFEDAAFALRNDGEISKPAETSLGWHIIKRISRRPVGSLEEVRRTLTERIKRDSRIDVAKQSLVEHIKRDNGFQEFPAVLSRWTSAQSSTVFCSADWKVNPARPAEILIRFDRNRTYSVSDFEDFCAKNLKRRIAESSKSKPLAETISSLYETWIGEVCMAVEEAQLEQKYPEFKNLMREYEEGILLFDAAKAMVWDRANSDTLGLERYFNQYLRDKYKWDERARVSIYTVKSDDPDLIQKVREFAATKNSGEVLGKFNKREEVLTVLEKYYEKGKNKETDNLWKAGLLSNAKTDSGTRTASFMKTEQILPPSPKTLAEARGYAVADYQDYLEKQWLETLRKEYSVSINEPVFRALVKK